MVESIETELVITLFVFRSRLASTSFAITKPEGLQESEQEMIPLLCSIFLTNQGSEDTKEETTTFTLVSIRASNYFLLILLRSPEKLNLLRFLCSG